MRFVFFRLLDNNLSMSRAQFFIIGSAVIFLLERALPALTSWPVFIFPVFVILFMLVSRNNAADLPYITIAAIIFDFFSGYPFGFFTIAILGLVAAIFIFKSRFNVEPTSFISLAIYLLLFVFAYFALVSIKSNSAILLSQAPVIIIETLIIFALFVLAARLTNAKFRKI